MRCILFCIMLCLCVGPALASADYEASITIGGAVAPPRTLDARLFSGNIEWTENGSTLLDKDGAFYADAVKALHDFGHPLIRFPGGRLASTYDWKNGIGPLAQRGQGYDFNNKRQPIRFGTDEFITLLNDLDARGMITVNPKLAASHAADWLRYVNGRGSRVPYWEVGNETYLRQDPSFMTAVEYAAVFTSMSSVLHEVDPKVRVGALLEANFINFPWVKPLIPQVDEWNQTDFEKVGNAADFYSIHLYGPFGTSRSEDDTRQAVLAVPGVFAIKLATLKDAMAQRSIAVPLQVTEFNILTDSIKDNWKYSLDPIQGTFIMDSLLVFAQAGVEAAYYWTSIGSYNFGLLESAEKRTLRPAAATFKNLAPYRGAAVLGAEVACPMLQLEKIGIVTHLEQKRIPALNALCLSLADGSMAVLAVNRSTTGAARLRINAGDKPLRALAVQTVATGNTAAPEGGLVVIPPAAGVIIRVAP